MRLPVSSPILQIFFALTLAVCTCASLELFATGSDALDAENANARIIVLKINVLLIVEIKYTKDMK